VWVGLLAWVAGTWFGLSGVGLTLVAATRWYRRSGAVHNRVVSLHAARLEKIWVMPLAVCVRTGSGSIWMCRDEMTAPAWAALLRWLYRHLPVQAVGFNISK